MTSTVNPASLEDALKDLCKRYGKPTVAKVAELLQLTCEGHEGITEDDVRAALGPKQRLLVADPMSNREIEEAKRAALEAERRAAQKRLVASKPREHLKLTMELEISGDGCIIESFVHAGQHYKASGDTTRLSVTGGTLRLTVAQL
jgi:hypothetical protein